MYASRDIPLGMLVPAGAENGQEEGQAQREQQRQLEQQQQGQQGLSHEQRGSGSEAGASAPDERQQSAANEAQLQVSATRVMNDMVESKLPEVRCPVLWPAQGCGLCVHANVPHHCLHMGAPAVLLPNRVCKVEH